MKITLPAFGTPYSVLTSGALCYSRDQLRARDLEVARVVLEAAADRITGRGYGSYEFAQAIRAIEVSHE